MGNIAKALGFLLILYAIVAGLRNFGLWSPWFLGDIAILWNPIAVLALGKGVPIPLIGDYLATIISGLVAGFYSFVLFILGLFMLK